MAQRKAPQLAGLIGFPVSHSISPLFQQAALDALQLPVRYERWETPPAELPARIAMLRQDGYLGANVTVPHKEAVVPLLDEIDDTARRAGAVNTIYKRDGRLLGANTDVAGFRRALREAGGFDATGKRALVLGAGGAARAVVLALAHEGAGSVAIANRSPERAGLLVAELRADAGPELAAVPWAEATSASGLEGIDLLVHCTTLGLAGSEAAGRSPLGEGVLRPELFVFDIVANPLQTPLLRQAEAAGARFLGGLPMLVYQGAASFEYWTGKPAPVPVMLAAAAGPSLPASPTSPAQKGK